MRHTIRDEKFHFLSRQGIRQPKMVVIQEMGFLRLAERLLLVILYKAIFVFVVVLTASQL